MPLTKEVLQFELAACFGEVFRQSFKEDLLGELRKIHQDHEAKLAEAMKLAVAQVLADVQPPRPSPRVPEPLAAAGGLRAPMDVIAEPSAGAVKSATDWVTPSLHGSLGDFRADHEQTSAAPPTMQSAATFLAPVPLTPTQAEGGDVVEPNSLPPLRGSQDFGMPTRGV